MTTTRSELISIPVPEETSHYKPVSSALIFDTIDQFVSYKGLHLRKEEFDTKQKGEVQRMRFHFDTGNPKFGFQVAVLNSYNKTLSLRCGGGAISWICYNLQIMAPYKLQERHVTDVREDMHEFFKGIFDLQTSQVTNAQTIWNAFDYVNLTRREMAELAGRAIFEENLLIPEQVSKIRKELEEPSFKYDYNPESLNSLYQHFTHAIKDTHPFNYFQTQQGVQNFFIDAYEEITQNKLILA